MPIARAHPLLKGDFDDSEHPRDEDGKFIAARLAIVGAGVAAAFAYPSIARRFAPDKLMGYISRSSGFDVPRGTTHLGLRDAIRAWRHIPGHVSDLFRLPTAVGKAPTGKELRRQFARSSLAHQERMIVTDREGRVLHNVAGDANKVEVPSALNRQIDDGKVGRIMHSHPIDSVPSTADTMVSHSLHRGAKKSPIDLVYGFGRTKAGKTRVRVTRYDSAPFTNFRDDALQDPRVRDIGGDGFLAPWRRENAIRGVYERNNLQEQDWLAAAGSNYRTKAVEKMTKAAVAFVEAEHARGEHGRFTAGVRDSRDPAPAPASTGNVVTLAPRRPKAAKNAFTVQDLVDQRPDGMPAAEHAARKARLKKLIVSLAPATIERGHETIKRGAMKGTTLIPTDTAAETISRAYTHAAMLALHGFGVARYDYSMPEAVKQELTPLVPFMRYAQRRVLNTMLDVEKGQWKPYRAAFGEPFKDKRRDKVTGDVRLRMQPRQQVIKAAPMGALVKAFEEEKHKRSHDGEFTGANANVQLAAGAIGGAAAAYTGSRAAKKSVARAGTIVGRRTGAAVRLAARHFDIAKTPEIASVVRDQSRLVGSFAGRQTRKRLGFGVALGAGLLGNYGGELIARRAGGASGTDDAYQGATLGGFAAGALGIIAGHKAGIGRFSRFSKAGGILGRLGKAFEEGKHKRAHDGEFAGEGGSSEEQSALAQPAQLLGGAVGAAAAVHAVGHVVAKPAARAAAGARKAASSGFLRFASDSRAASNVHSAKLVHLQAKGIGHAAHWGTHGAVSAAIGIGAGLAGDLIGDWGARKATGAKGHDDEYRHASIIGMTTGMVGAALGHARGSSKLWRGLRYSPKLRTARGFGGAVAGSIAAEVAGNVVDEKAGATDLLAGVNRRTAGRFERASKAPIGKAAPMGTLAKAYLQAHRG